MSLHDGDEGRSEVMLKALSAMLDTSRATSSSITQSQSSATISLVTTLPALQDMEHKWRELESATQNHISVFQSFDWVMAWAETYVTGDSKITLHVVAAYDGDELVFVWPLMRKTTLGFSVLSWLTDPYGQYGDVLVRHGHCTKRWIEHTISFLRRLKDVDLLRLRHVREDSHLSAHAKHLLVDARMQEGAPWLDLTQFADEAAYDARYTSAQRKRRKKIRKSLEELGPVTFTQLPAGVLADQAIAKAISEKNAWLAERGRFNRVLGCTGHLSFLKTLSRRLNGSVDVVVTELKAGDTTISWEISFRHATTHYAYITSHMNTYTDLSPGRLHMDLSQRACIAAGMKVFDLMVPNDPHKETWSSASALAHDYYLPLSFSGKLVGSGYIRTIRPLLRTFYYGLNASILRRFKLGRLVGQSSAKEPGSV
jgi:CelD/BcsL family acetyltransferase involved in cellulose biosynthesis